MDGIAEMLMHLCGVHIERQCVVVEEERPHAY